MFKIEINIDIFPNIKQKYLGLLGILRKIW